MENTLGQSSDSSTPLTVPNELERELSTSRSLPHDPITISTSQTKPPPPSNSKQPALSPNSFGTSASSNQPSLNTDPTSQRSSVLRSFLAGPSSHPLHETGTSRDAVQEWRIKMQRNLDKFDQSFKAPDSGKIYISKAVEEYPSNIGDIGDLDNEKFEDIDIPSPRPEVLDLGIEACSPAPPMSQELPRQSWTSRELAAKLGGLPSVPPDRSDRPIEPPSATPQVAQQTHGWAALIQRALQTTRNDPEKSDLEEFDFLHYGTLLPCLQGLLPQNIGASIGVAERAKHREIEIVTHKKLPNESQIQKAIAKLLPPAFRDSVSLTFAQGRAIRSVQTVGSKNYHHNRTVLMGDSIGVDNDTGSAATAGPAIELGSKRYRINSFHLFSDHFQNPSTSSESPVVIHPSLMDLTKCTHQIKGDTAHPKVLGKVKYQSAYTLEATRTSNHSYALKHGKGKWEVLMDWAATEEDKETQAPNVVRIPKNGAEEDIYVTESCEVRRGVPVYSIGRSSGLQMGRVRRQLTWMNGIKNETGRETFEWAIEMFDEKTEKEEWDLRGMGVGGDSGAGVIDLDSGKLCGTIWGTSNDKSTSRVAYFTPWNDIAEDIQKKTPNLKPRLSQKVSKAVRYPLEPICDRCAEDQEPNLKEIQPVAEKIRSSAVALRSSTASEMSPYVDVDDTQSTASGMSSYIDLGDSQSIGVSSNQCSTSPRTSSSARTSIESAQVGSTKIARSSDRAVEKIVTKLIGDLSGPPQLELQLAQDLQTPMIAV